MLLAQAWLTIFALRQTCKLARSLFTWASGLHLCCTTLALQFCPLGINNAPTKPDVNTQMLLAETLGAVAALARPKLSKDTVAAIQARPHQLDLTAVHADPCSDLFELRQRDQALLDAATAAAERTMGAQGRGGEVLDAAKQELAEAQRQVQVDVLEPRRRRRQLYQQVGVQLHNA
jgi:hypothetical protein